MFTSAISRMMGTSSSSSLLSPMEKARGIKEHEPVPTIEEYRKTIPSMILSGKQANN